MKPWRETLLSILAESGEEFLSGEQLAEKFGCSRAAVWKKISILRSEGYPIEASTHRGYRLLSKSREFARQVEEALKSRGLEGVFDVIVVDATPSTNLMAREAGTSGAREFSVFAALRQTAGRGRRGRAWVSDEGGLWFSILLRPDMDPRAASTVTLLFGLCILKALRETCGISAGIKWPNDIVSMLNGKKICGILSETSMEDNLISYAVVGCGVNVSQETFPPEIESVATSLYLEGVRVSGADLLAAILAETALRYPEFVRNPKAFLPEYRANCATLGRPVRIESAVPEEGTAQDVSESGDLIVRKKDGTIVTCSSGEVSVRGMLGYFQI